MAKVWRGRDRVIEICFNARKLDENAILPTRGWSAQLPCSTGSEKTVQRSSATDLTTTSQTADTVPHRDPLGATFAKALGRKDFDTVLTLLDSGIDFRGLTPRRLWEATDANAVEEILRQWFDDTDVLEEIVSIDADSFADRQRVAYRFRGHNPGGPFVVEQQAYYTERAGRINYMRVLCSGFRPH